jgi:hypothetical protein
MHTSGKRGRRRRRRKRRKRRTREKEKEEEEEEECVDICLAGSKYLQLHQQNGFSRPAIQQVQAPVGNYVIMLVQAGAGEHHDMTQEISRSSVFFVPFGSSAQLMKLRPRCMPSGYAYQEYLLGEKSADAPGIGESHLVKGVIIVCVAAYDY